MKPALSRTTFVKRLREDYRLILALFSKDVLEAVKNKNVITILITSLLIVLLYQAMPSLSLGDHLPTLLITDSGSSRLVPLLEKSRNITLRTYPSEEKMKQVLANGEVPELGLVVPPGLDQALQAGETPKVQGYVLRWVSEADAERLRQVAQSEISSLLGQPVTIELAGKRVDLTPEARGLGLGAGFGMAYILIVIGLMVIPHLMLEEKQSRTLDMLTISPASAAHIVAGKALAGLFYCSLGGVVTLAVNQSLVVHWGVAILTVLLGSLFTVSLGLWLGMKIDSRAQLTMWASLLLLPLMIPILFTILQGLVPEDWVSAVKIIPSGAIFDLTLISFANPLPTGRILLLSAWIAAASLLVLAVVAWNLRRRDQETGVLPTSLQQAMPNAVGAIRASLRPVQKTQAPAQTRPPVTDRILIRSEAHERPAPTLRSGLAVIGAIAGKDLLEAFKNKLLLSILLGSTFILLLSSAMIWLLSSRNLPLLVVYDQGHSALLRGLTSREDFRLGIFASQVEMETALVNSPNLAIGLILPVDFDQLARSGQAIPLQAFFPHWINQEQLPQQLAFFEARLNGLSAAGVRLTASGNSVYPSPDTNRQPLLIQFNLISYILVIGIAMVPMLLIEEKEAKTLMALLVSPASRAQILLGKVLVGLFYSIIPTLLFLGAFHYLFVHWEIVILAVFLSATLAVILGLLVGTLADTPTNASMWASLLMVVTIGSALVKIFSGFNLPPAIQSLLEWLPGSTMLQLFSLSRAGAVPPSLLWPNVIALSVTIALISILLLWRLRRIEG